MLLGKVLYFFIGLINSVVNLINFVRKDVRIQKGAVIKGKIYIENQGAISIGTNFHANSGGAYNPIGGDTVLRLVTFGQGRLDIGNNVSISNSTLCCEQSICIQDNVFIGGGCRIWDSDFHSIDKGIRNSGKDQSYKKSPILIKSSAFIGGGVIILKGVTIGEGAVVGAGSVVTKSIPNNEVWGGNPASFIKVL